MSDNYQEEINILLKARGKDSVESDLDDTAKSAKQAADQIRAAWKQSYDAIKNFPTDQIKKSISGVQAAISSNFNIGVDWKDLFSGMEDAFKSQTGNLSPR